MNKLLKTTPILRGFDYTPQQIQDTIDNKKILQIAQGISVKCNYKCLYCFVWERETRGRLLTNQEIKKVLKQAANLGAQTWYIAERGEPLLHPGIEELVDYANSLGIYVVMSTNGSKITDKLARDWKNKKISFQTKAHSLNPSVFAELAGIKKARFEKLDDLNLPNGLAKLLKYGYHKTQPTRVGIEAVMIRQNINELPGILRLARKYSLFVHFEEPIREGRVRLNPDIIVSKKKQQQLIKELARIDIEEFGFQAEYSSHHYGFNKDCPIRLQYQLVINFNGEAKICFSNAAELLIGMNVKNYSLKQIQEKRLKMLERLKPKECVCMKYSMLNPPQL